MICSLYYYLIYGLERIKKIENTRSCEMQSGKQPQSVLSPQILCKTRENWLGNQGKRGESRKSEETQLAICSELLTQVYHVIFCQFSLLHKTHLFILVNNPSHATATHLDMPNLPRLDNTIR